MRKERKMNAITTQENLALDINRVDFLGQLLAQIDTLKEQADSIKDQLKDEATMPGADKSFVGEFFKATVSESNRTTIDNKAFQAALVASGVDADVIAKCVAAASKTSAVFAVKVTSR